jgi:hypothetical protein
MMDGRARFEKLEQLTAATFAQNAQVFLTARLAKHVQGFGVDFVERAGLAHHIEQLNALRVMSDCPTLGNAAVA